MGGGGQPLRPRRALVLLALFGVTLLFPSLSERLTRPLVRLGRGCRDRPPAPPGRSPLYRSFLLGSPRLLWAPAPGRSWLDPDGAALKGASAQSSLLLFASPQGRASLALALVIGGRVFQRDEALAGRGGVDSARVGGGVALRRRRIALGLDTGLLTQLSLARTAASNRGWSTRSHPDRRPTVPRRSLGLRTKALPSRRKPAVARRSGRVVKLSPANRRGACAEIVWSTSGPTPASTASSLPYIRAWAEKVQRPGAVVVGVHAPEFRLREGPGQRPAGGPGAESRLPGAVDNDFALWRAFDNRYCRRTISWMRRAGTAPPLWRRGVMRPRSG